MAGPGVPGAQTPPGIDAFVRDLADIRRELRELGPSIAESFAPVIADLQAKQAALDAQQVQINGQLAQINALIGSQVTSVAGLPGIATGFNVGTSQATKASTTIAVPSGYSQALVVAIGSLTFADTAANRFDTRCGIAGDYGLSLPNLANTVGSTAASHSRNLSGLSGGTITLDVQALAAVSATNAANTAIVTGFAIFFR